MQTLQRGSQLSGGTYRIEKILGQGSFGITYLATARLTTQGKLGKMDVEAKVAIKEFFMSEVNSRKSDGSSVDGSSGSVFTNYRQKFRKEAENLSRLSHPNIVKVFDVFDENNTTYYVMEFLEGTNLDDYIGGKGRLSEEESIAAIKEVGGALAYMHSRKMLHLDIKPKNIMRRSDGRYCLIDFGLSKQYTEGGEPESSTSIGLGTPGYAPIEQSGYKQDGTFPATLDVYALGATMYKMLTGKRPPEATYILNEGFPDEDLTSVKVSENTRNALKKAMSPIRKQRYSSVEAVVTGMTGCGDTIGNAKVPPEDTQVLSADEVKDVIPDAPDLEPLHNDTKDSGRPQDSLSLNVAGADSEQSGEGREDRGEYRGYINGHEWVDLGLPSGLKWATCNIGATSELESGDYFAWGETESKNEYTEESYKYNRLETYTQKKYFGLKTIKLNYYEYRNLRNISGNSHDAARANWGGSWRMPTESEFLEIIENCEWQKSLVNGQVGYKVTGPNGNSIFLIGTGCEYGEEGLIEENWAGYYWTSSQDEKDNENALSFSFNKYSPLNRAPIKRLKSIWRIFGLNIRAVSS